MPTYQDACPRCAALKDTRAVHCHSCRRYTSPRNGTGKDWSVHNGTGYVVKFLDGRWQYQHRWVMEQALGRKLSRSEHVHHKNGDKTDNRLENLEVLLASEHHRHHATPERMKAMSVLGHEAKRRSAA